MEWLRLLFALQVAFEHAGAHLGYPIPAFIAHFPGVPAFFFVSGFLIYASYLNSPGQRYFENRFLRLFPGLVFVTLGGAAVALTAHGWHDLAVNAPSYAIWLLAQTTLGQAYNPALFRDVGVGVINGSLWTLTTEILFYAVVPVIACLEQRFRFTVLALFMLSFTIFVFGPLLANVPVYRNKTAYDLIALTPVAWGWMFFSGILALKYFAQIQRWLKFLPLLAIPGGAMAALGDGPMFGSVGNRLGLLYFACYVGLVLWFAFSTRCVRLSFDLSYGCYVWHMPIINLLLVLAIPSLALAIGSTVAMAVLSWFLVERPALRLKRQSLKSLND